MDGVSVNILVVKPSSLGDVIHTFPAVDLIRRCYPDAFISWVVNDSLVGVVELLPSVDEVIVFNRKRLGRLGHCHEFLFFLRELRQHKYDLALDFQGLFRSGLISFASGAPRRIGFRCAREQAGLFYTEKVFLPANLKHAVDKNVFLVRSALEIAEPMQLPTLEANRDFVKGAQRLFSQHGLSEGGPLLAVAPASRWLSKTWPADFFAGVLDRVSSAVPSLRCWVLGTQEEQGVVESVIASCTNCRPCNLAGTTNIGTLTEMLRCSDVLLTNDSGPMHLAAALKVPTVAMFGPTDPELTGPYGDNHHVFIGNCRQGPCFSRNCPFEKRTCVENVSVESVAAAVIQAIDAKSGARKSD